MIRGWAEAVKGGMPLKVVIREWASGGSLCFG